MRMPLTNVWGLCLFLGLACYALAQAPQPAPPVPPAKPGDLREAAALTFPEGTELKLPLVGTERMAVALGEARVQRDRGITRVDVSLQGMRAAENFGPDFQTFVLWAASPEGVLANLGEFLLKNDRARLQTATTLQTFALFVTAEPYYLVQQPSGLTVLSAEDAINSFSGQYRALQATYTLSTNEYRVEKQSIGDAPEFKGEVIVNPKQAELAIAIAERGLAAQYSQAELGRARESFSNLLAALRQGATDPRVVSMYLHDAVRWVVQAERFARTRSMQAQYDAKQKAYESEFRRAEAAEAKQRDTQDRLEHTETELARSRANTDKTAMALQLALREKEEALNLMAQADQARDQLEDALQKLRQAQQNYHDRFISTLARVAEVKETGRGIVVNLPDVAFDKGKSTINETARQILSRLTGVLLVASNFRLSVEGHTDSTGRPAKNKELSMERAQNAAEFLVDSGIPQDRISIEGFGEKKPIDTNKTAAGRARNRRVEIVIFDLSVN